MPNVSLTPQMQAYAEAQVASGAYANVSEVIRAGMRKLMDEDGLADFIALREEIQRSLKEPVVEVDLREEFLGKRP